MKGIILSIIGICCILTASCENPFGLTDEQLEYLANMDPSLLPAELITKAGDNSHWCCTNDQPVQTVQRSKVDKGIHVVSTKIRVGYTGCGFFDSCSLYEVRYKQVAVYFISYYEVPDESACPDHHVKCCVDFILVAQNCLSLASVGANIQLILLLAQQGLIERPFTQMPLL